MYAIIESAVKSKSRKRLERIQADLLIHIAMKLGVEQEKIQEVVNKPD